MKKAATSTKPTEKTAESPTKEVKMQVSVEDFVNTITPGRRTRSGSKLDQFKEHLEALHLHGCSIGQLQLFLEQNGVKVTAQTLTKYLHKNDIREIQVRPHDPTKPDARKRGRKKKESNGASAEAAVASGERPSVWNPQVRAR